MDSESAKKLAKTGNEKGTMLFGIKRDQKEANFANLGLGPADAILISSDLAIGALTVVNLLGNRLDAESAKTLAEVAKQKGISLCGIQRDQTTADFVGKGLQPPDAILLASDLSQAVVTGSLKVTDLLHNELDAESAKMLAEVAKQKGISLCGIQRSQTTADFSNQSLKPPDAMLLASDLSQAGVTGALTHLSLVDNIKLGDEGVEALSVAIEQSMSLSKLDLSNSVSSTIFGPKGATTLAKALAINSSLTQIEYVPPDSDLPNVDNSLPAPELFRHPLVPSAFWCLCLQVAGQLPWWEGCQSGRRRLACQQLAQEGKFPYQPTSA